MFYDFWSIGDLRGEEFLEISVVSSKSRLLHFSFYILVIGQPASSQAASQPQLATQQPAGQQAASFEFQLQFCFEFWELPW